MTHANNHPYHSMQTHHPLNPDSLDEWFPIAQQRNYISTLKGRVGITRLRSEYFVRLWAYLLLKQQHEQGQLKRPLTQLEIPDGFVPCTHREAAELFYGNKSRGSERAAGMMLDKLVALGLIEKQFDGNTICIRVQAPPTETTQPTQPIQLKPDTFNPKTDAVPVANFLARNYSWMNKKLTAVPHKIARVVRRWAGQYPAGMRVMRRCDTLHPVGFYALYPTASESEEYFFLPPSKSLYLSTHAENDPIQIATPGDLECTSIFVRSWLIDTPYMQPPHISQFLKDAQATILQMKVDFPNLCDMYALVIHPKYEKLTLALGFQKTYQDPQLGIYWMYTAVDQFLALNIEQAVSGLELAASPDSVA